MRLELSRCVVRSWRAEDAPSIAPLANNRLVWINLRDAFPHPYTLADAEAFIRAALALSPPTRFAIDVDGRAVGSIGLSLHTDVERVSAEIGYWLGEPYWGRGIMTEAVVAVTEHAIRAHALTRVFAVPYEWNPASFRVLEKAGYACEARMRRSAIKDGKVIDQRLYAFVPEPVAAK
ncbi:MAG: GNAT family N-acetyltransferase [bacterium]